MKSLKAFPTVLALASVLALGSSRARAADGLQIDKAVCGSGDSWRDVTAFLQGKVQGDTLSVDISQPFEEIGGDPAPSQAKKLLIDYHLKGEAYRLSLTEEYPVAFAIRLPSSEAVAPGTTPLPKATMAAPPVSVGEAPSRKTDDRALIFLAFGLSIFSTLCAVVALTRIRQLRRELSKKPNAT
jgi:hypothetical protein